VDALFGHRGGGLVNAVLRKLAGEGEPDPDSASPAERWSHPEDLVDRWTAAFGPERTEALMRWNNGIPDLGACMGGGGEGLAPGSWLQDYRILPRTGSSPLESLDGPFYLQDEAAALVGRTCAGLAAGLDVLEIGAAPGGKTHHLGETAVSVVSMDSSPGRMERWMGNFRRLGWTGCHPLVGDGTRPPLACSFGMVLVDAPCTNTGVYRRRPDARWKWSADYLEGMTVLQRELLASASALVAPGGYLVYSTCSLEEEENQGQVRVFEECRDDFRRVPLDAPAELVTDGAIGIFPPEHGIDGLFAVAWRRVD